MKQRRERVSECERREGERGGMRERGQREGDTETERGRLFPPTLETSVREQYLYALTL